MRSVKKMIALLLVLSFCVSAGACSKKNELSPEPPEELAPTAEPAPAEALAEEALASDATVAAKLGAYTVTVDEVASEYEYFVTYMSYYGMSVPTDPAEINEYVEMIVDNKIADLAVSWQADEQGITLSAEDEAEVEAGVQAHLAEIEESYREGVAEELGASATEEEIAARVKELIDQDVMDYMGVDLDTYLDSYRVSLVSAKKSALLQEKVTSSVTLGETDADDWYAKTVETDRTAVEADPLSYREIVQDYESGASELPAFYAPEGFVRAQIIKVAMDADSAAAYAENKTQMTALESEFGALALKGEEPARRGEIRTTYNALVSANAELEQAVLTKAEAIREEAATSNITFAELSKKYDESLSDADAENGHLVYTAGEDTAYPAAVREAVAALGDGDISDIIAVDGTFYIVRRVNAVAAGAPAMEEVRELAETRALSEKKDAAWNEAASAYASAAAAAAAKYPEHYASIG